MKYEEVKILQRIKNGDLKEYESLFKKYYTELCGFANKYLKNIHIAEEIVQELFYKLWKNKNTLVITTSIKAYLYKSIKNNCLQYLQHKSIEYKYADFLKHSVNGYTKEDPLGTLKMKEINKIIAQTMNKLSVNTRRIFRLSRFEGLKYREIAEKLSISIKTVEANMGLALKAFRESLKDYTS